jgi:hypothetical protein
VKPDRGTDSRARHWGTLRAMRSPRSAALLAVALSALAPGRALAEDASNQAAAQALFDQARQLMADGKYSEACPKLVESERLDPGAGTLLNLGHCYEKSGQTASAWVTFKDAAAAADLKHRADWSGRARERAQALEPLLSKLVIEVPASARAGGLQVRRDGVEVGSAVWGTPIPTDPGPHALEAVAPAKKRWATTVTVRPNGDIAHVVVPSLEDEPAASAAPPVSEAPLPPATLPPSARGVAPPPATEPASSDGSTQRTVGLVVGGAGVIGLGFGVAFGLVALGKNSDSKSLCPASPCSGSSGVQGIQDNSDAKSAATVSTVAMAVGGAALATGAVVFLLAPKKRSATALHVTPAIGGGELGLRLGGAF